MIIHDLISAWSWMIMDDHSKSQKIMLSFCMPIGRLIVFFYFFDWSVVNSVATSTGQNQWETMWNKRNLCDAVRSKDGFWWKDGQEWHQMSLYMFSVAMPTEKPEIPKCCVPRHCQAFLRFWAKFLCFIRLRGGSKLMYSIWKHSKSLLHQQEHHFRPPYVFDRNSWCWHDSSLFYIMMH